MSTAPLVSVVIPCYNARHWVSDAIQSALTQTYPRVEVIVVDDGSSDGTTDVLRSFGKQIRWETGPNSGASAARNRGLRRAAGEWIQFLDADDLLHPEKLTLQMPLVVANDRSIVYCDRQTHALGNPQESRVDSPTLLADPIVFALSKIVSLPAPVISRVFLQEIGGFRESLPCVQDYDLFLRLACAGATFRHLPEVLVTVRRVPNSVSSDIARLFDNWLDVYWTAYNLLDRAGELTDDRSEAFAARLVNDARWCLRLGLKQRAFERFAAAERMHATGGLKRGYGRAALVMRAVLGPVFTETVLGVAKTGYRHLARRISGLYHQGARQ
jgi:glycosyltransferase involved in cell wall biosynthesis